MSLKIHQPDQLQIRWLIRRDMEEVLAIEQASFEFQWTEEDFLCCLRQRNCIGMVAEQDGKIVGFMIYELHKSRLHILNFAVSPGYRRQQIGQRMIQRLIDKLSQQRRREIVTEVRESNLSAQLFFKSLGFLAITIVRGRYEDTEEAAYIMSYLLIEESAEETTFKPTNRISSYDLYDRDAA
ncbi:GNAT family protein [Lacunimicrobium album]